MPPIRQTLMRRRCIRRSWRRLWFRLAFCPGSRPVCARNSGPKRLVVGRLHRRHQPGSTTACCRSEGSTSSSPEQGRVRHGVAMGEGYDFQPPLGAGRRLRQQRQILRAAHQHGWHHRTRGGESKGMHCISPEIGKLPLQNNFYLFGKLAWPPRTTKTLWIRPARSRCRTDGRNRKRTCLGARRRIYLHPQRQRSLDYTRIHEAAIAARAKGRQHLHRRPEVPFLAPSPYRMKRASDRWPFCLARPAGFEPTTPWFVAKYSIQLSSGARSELYQRLRKRE